MAFFILSLVVPIGLLTALKSTGVLHGPVVVSETRTLETMDWSFERPTSLQPLDLWYKIEKTDSTDISMNFTIFIGNYIPKSEYGGSSLVNMNSSLSASLSRGYIENVNITFSDEYLDSFVRIPQVELGGASQTLAVWNNLTATGYSDFLSGMGKTEKAFMNLKGTNQPMSIYLRISPEWALRSPSSQTQQFSVNIEVTYFNGILHKKVIQPFSLRLIGSTSA